MKANIHGGILELIVDKINTAACMLIQHALVNKHVNCLRIPYGSIDHLKRVNLSRDTSISHSPILGVLSYNAFIFHKECSQCSSAK